MSNERFASVKCFECGEFGHYANYCRRGRGRRGPGGGWRDSGGRRTTTALMHDVVVLAITSAMVEGVTGGLISEEGMDGCQMNGT